MQSAPLCERLPVPLSVCLSVSLSVCMCVTVCKFVHLTPPPPPLSLSYLHCERCKLFLKVPDQIQLNGDFSQSINSFLLVFVQLSTFFGVLFQRKELVLEREGGGTEGGRERERERGREGERERERERRERERRREREEGDLLIIICTYIQ